MQPWGAKRLNACSAPKSTEGKTSKQMTVRQGGKVRKKLREEAPSALRCEQRFSERAEGLRRMGRKDLQKEGVCEPKHRGASYTS